MVTEIVEGKCVGCRKLMVRLSVDEWCICDSCESKYPPSLLKACGDPFEYALRTSWGATIAFSEAFVHGEWVHLKLTMGADYDLIGYEYKWPLGMERGVDIRVADIVWCCDTGH